MNLAFKHLLCFSNYAIYNAHKFSYDKNIFVKWPGTLCKESNNLVRNYKLHTFTDLQRYSTTI